MPESDKIEKIKRDLTKWVNHNKGTFIMRQGRDTYSRTPDPVKTLEKILDNRDIEDLDFSFDEDKDVFPSVLITVGKDMFRFISIPEDLNDISDIIEEYVDSNQPKDLFSKTHADLDQKSLRVMQGWLEKRMLNSQLDQREKELKLYIASVAFLKEIEQLNRYPESSQVGDLINYFLKQI